MEVKQDGIRDVQVESKVPTVAAKRVLEERDNDDLRETKVKKEGSVVQTTETRVTRRRSSRLQK